MQGTIETFKFVALIANVLFQTNRWRRSVLTEKVKPINLSL